MRKEMRSVLLTILWILSNLSGLCPRELISENAQTQVDRSGMQKHVLRPIVKTFHRWVELTGEVMRMTAICSKFP
jgi:hypothetical protein